jgi:3(or 17)beta-hydroxysteroid dehydrogenase
MGRLGGKVAIVTGAAKGLGEADARLFAAEGAKVVVADVDVANGERVAREIGGNAIFRQLDVTSEAAWKALIEEVVGLWGGLHILVNNAGVVKVDTPETITQESFDFVMGVSINGTVWGCKHAIPAMRASGGGSIINMASIASICGEPYVASYCAAKGAIEAYSRSVAVYCAQNKIPIRCNSIHPAGIDTPMVQSMGAKLEEAEMLPLADNNNAAGLNRLGHPNDIGWLVVFLASDESRFISGQQFIVDNTASVTQGAVPSAA